MADTSMRADAARDTLPAQANALDPIYKEVEKTISRMLADVENADREVRNILFAHSALNPSFPLVLRGSCAQWLSLALDAKKQKLHGALRAQLLDLADRLSRQAEEKGNQNLGQILWQQQMTLDKGYEERELRVHQAYQRELEAEREKTRKYRLALDQQKNQMERVVEERVKAGRQRKGRR
ncbi:hypothetical protein DENSPDRAFT_196428 [Dentipellis sp. KUC8613]|nr:hypothetical protein DENSPDRAFT_196428 [Dentipellis sp. KUC8613]